MHVVFDGIEDRW